MRPRAPLPALLVALALLLVACDGDALTAPELPDPVRYVALGDSIAAGTAATTSYVTEFTQRFAQEHDVTVETVNTGVPGWTTQQLLDALRDDEHLRREVTGAHLVTVNIGGNDLLPALASVLQGTCGGDDGQACLREAAGNFTDTWDELLAELAEVTGGELAHVRTMDLYLPAQVASLPPEVGDALANHLATINDHLTRTATGAGLAVAEVHAAFHEAGAGDAQGEDPAGDDGPAGVAAAARAADLLADDGIHPNAAGHARIADALLALGAELRTTG